MSFVDEIAAVVGPGNFFQDGAIDDRYRRSMSPKLPVDPAYVARPAGTAEVAAILRAANAAKVPVTTLGGGTGVVGGISTVPGTLMLSLERMRKIEEIDAQSLTMTAEAGVTIQAAHEAADAKNLFFPLDLGSRGSATIGGTIGTNAGGNRVIRWGMMRDMVLGLEAVLADGSVVKAFSKVVKDNAGYNWKHLLIGSEGTLGVVTRAVLRLRPKPRTTQTAIVAVAKFDAVVAILRRLESALGGTLSAFEVMWDNFYDRITTANAAKRERPLPLGYKIYVLVEALGSDPANDAARFESALSELLGEGLAADAVIAQSERDAQRLWAVREDLQEPMMKMYPMFAFDVSMPIPSMPEFVARADAGLRTAFPNANNLFYGHLGDGNLHLVTGVGSGDADTEHKVDSLVYDIVGSLGGSISAEHGVGLTKRDYLARTRSASEIDMMRRIKRALDPNNILNPGKIFHGDPMTSALKLRRSFSYVPGSYPQLLEGAVKLAADVICFDLEDSVPPPKKEEARAAVVRTVSSQDYRPREALVRVNGFDTQWGEADLKAVAALPIDGVLLPKSESAANVRKAADIIGGASPRFRIWCQIETPRGVLRAEEIAAAHPRVEGFVIGGADLVETLHARNTPMRLPLLGPLTHTIVVARAYGLAVIDAVHPNYQDDSGFDEACQQAVELGFDGKSTVFPRQIEGANKAFGPSADAIDHARKAIAAASQDGGGSGYENLHLVHARKLLELADAIAERQKLFG